MESNKNNRPLILEIDETKQDLIQVINNAIQVRQLPFYILDMILSDVHRQVSDAAKAEIAQVQNTIQTSQHVQSDSESKTE